MLKKINEILIFCLKVYIVILIISFYFIFNIKEINNTVHYLYLSKNEFELGCVEDIKEFVMTNYKIIEYPTDYCKTLGLKEITFIVENDNYEAKKLNITIKDTKQPDISQTNDTLLENTNFDIYNFIKVSDNDQHIVVNYEPKQLLVGENKLEVIAKDSSGNQTVENIKITVLKTETKNTVITPKVEISADKITPKQVFSPQKFLFSDGYDFNTAYDACKSVLEASQNGTCLPLKNDKNVYIGYEFSR